MSSKNGRISHKHCTDHKDRAHLSRSMSGSFLIMNASLIWRCSASRCSIHCSQSDSQSVSQSVSTVNQRWFQFFNAHLLSVEFVLQMILLTNVALEFGFSAIFTGWKPRVQCTKYLTVANWLRKWEQETFGRKCELYNERKFHSVYWSLDR